MIPSWVLDWSTYNQFCQTLLSSFLINKFSNREIIDSYIDKPVRPQMSSHTSESGQ